MQSPDYELLNKAMTVLNKAVSKSGDTKAISNITNHLKSRVDITEQKMQHLVDELMHDVYFLAEVLKSDE